MNGDLISRVELIKQLEQRHLDDVFIKRGLPPVYKMSLKCNRALKAQGDAIRDVINGLPAVDAVRVTRCKDCAYYEYGEHFHDMQFCCGCRGRRNPCALQLCAGCFLQLR